MNKEKKIEQMCAELRHSEIDRDKKGLFAWVAVDQSQAVPVMWEKYRLTSGHLEREPSGSDSGRLLQM